MFGISFTLKHTNKDTVKTTSFSHRKTIQKFRKNNQTKATTQKLFHPTPQVSNLVYTKNPDRINTA